MPGARGRSSELSRGRREPSPQCRFASAGSRLRDTCEGVVWTSPGGTLPSRVFPPQAVCASPAGSRRSSVRGGVGSPDLGARAQTHAHTNHLCMHTQLTRLCMAARAHTHSRTLIHAHTRRLPHMLAHAHTLTHQGKHMGSHTGLYTHRLTQTRAHSMLAHTQIPSHTRTRTLIHAHTCLHTHAHAQPCAQAHTHPGARLPLRTRLPAPRLRPVPPGFPRFRCSERFCEAGSSARLGSHSSDRPRPCGGPDVSARKNYVPCPSLAGRADRHPPSRARASSLIYGSHTPAPNVPRSWGM